jgi:hypothetical protein
MLVVRLPSLFSFLKMRNKKGLNNPSDTTEKRLERILNVK